MSHPDELSGVAHNANGVRVMIDREGDKWRWARWSVPLLGPPAAGLGLNLACLSVTLHRATIHTCSNSATRSASLHLREDKKNKQPVGVGGWPIQGQG